LAKNTLNLLALESIKKKERARSFHFMSLGNGGKSSKIPKRQYEIPPFIKADNHSSSSQN